MLGIFIFFLSYSVLYVGSEPGSGVDLDVVPGAGQGPALEIGPGIVLLEAEVEPAVVHLALLGCLLPSLNKHQPPDNECPGRMEEHSTTSSGLHSGQSTTGFNTNLPPDPEKHT